MRPSRYIEPSTRCVTLHSPYLTMLIGPHSSSALFASLRLPNDSSSLPTSTLVSMHSSHDFLSIARKA